MKLIQILFVKIEQHKFLPHFTVSMLWFLVTLTHMRKSAKRNQTSYTAFSNIKEKKIDVKTSNHKVNAFLDSRVAEVLLFYIILVLFEFWPILSQLHHYSECHMYLLREYIANTVN